MRIVVLSFLVLFISCGISKNTATPSEINNLKKAVTNKAIEANFDWASPLGLNNNVQGIENLLPPGSTSSNISLIGNPNFFIIKNDSISMDLPYYGRQQLSGGYGTDLGVEFDGKPKTEKKYYHEKKAAYIFEYTLYAKKESYDVTLTLFANKKSTLDVNSSHRTNISYNGNWKEYIATKE
ncbi:DUF4251 domain-containing protein [Polaribacter aestuariivivens]|uniref:DUF4251 domain-containing protein n=1 Tax=Polaribacter aestuariivivens TaxID=2304626 RepID=UPI003F49521B